MKTNISRDAKGFERERKRVLRKKYKGEERTH